MKHVIIILFLVITSAGYSAGKNITENNTIPLDDLNAEPVPGNPREYSVNIKFTKIEYVTVGTTVAAESLGAKHDRYTLPEKEWNYNLSTNTLTVNRDIDNSNYIVRVKGKYLTPMCIIPAEKIDPEQIRFVVNGRIGINGKDYIYNSIKNEIELPSCTTGQEKFIIQYMYSSGSASIGSMSMADFTRPLLEYLGWPVSGNAVKADNKGFYFSPSDNHYKSVWLVQLIPTGNGYTGQDIRSGFKWDAEENELKFDIPVDTEKFSVLILGEIE